MYKTIIILFLFMLPLNISAQVFPKEGSWLPYRIIGFSYSSVPKAKEYKIEIAKGTYNKAGTFVKNITQTAAGKNKRIIVEVPAFGSQYTWRIVYAVNKKTVSTPLYHFNTLKSDRVDTTKFHLKIMQPAARQYRDDYVCVDAGGVIYNMSGNPVWFIADTNGLGGYVVDLKFTAEGTMTFLYRKPFEINYNEDILWTTPDKDTVGKNSITSELYHHELTKLANGHYMVLGMQGLACKSMGTRDSSFFLVSKNKDSLGQNGYKPGKFGTILEYDANGNIAWSWNSIDYLKGSDFDYYRGIDSNSRFDPHDNAFYFDEQNKAIYLGYRNLSRIIKIEYPGGKVLRTYGATFKPGVPETGNGIFCNQHSIGRTRDGYLYIYNNNACQATNAAPTILMLQEPALPGDTLKKVWEYTCTVEENHPKRFNSGGNVIEMPDSSLFVNMGAEYSKLFIINRQKKVLWSALPEKFTVAGQKWTPVHESRSNIISRKGLERLIWTAENQVANGK